MSEYVIFSQRENKKFPYTLLKLHKQGSSIFYGKEYEEEYLKEFLCNRAIPSRIPHHIFEATDDESAILYYETMKDEVMYATT